MTILDYELLSNHHLLTTNDIEESRKITSLLWEEHDTFLKEGADFFVHINRVKLNIVSLSYIHCPADLILESTKEVEARYSFHILLDGDIDYQVASDKAEAKYESGVIHFSSEKMQMAVDSIRALFVDFDKTAVEQALSNRFGQSPPQLPKAAEIDYQSPQGLFLRSLSLWCAHQLNHPNCQHPNSKKWQHLEKTLLFAFIDCLDRRAKERTRQQENRYQWIKAVETWIDGHLHEPIMLQDLANVANVSERALQKAFRNFRNCTPMGAVYFRRLIKARSLLQAADEDTTVLQIAMEVGYTHPSRFASHYLKQFGEKPSQTLHKAKNKKTKNG